MLGVTALCGEQGDTIVFALESVKSFSLRSLRCAKAGSSHNRSGRKGPQRVTWSLSVLLQGHPASHHIPQDRIQPVWSISSEGGCTASLGKIIEMLPFMVLFGESAESPEPLELEVTSRKA